MHTSLNRRRVLIGSSLVVAALLLAAAAVVVLDARETSILPAIDVPAGSLAAIEQTASGPHDSGSMPVEPTRPQSAQLDDFEASLDALTRLADAGSWDKARDMALSLREAVASSPERPALVRRRISMAIQGVKNFRDRGDKDEGTRVALRQASYLGATLSRESLTALLVEAIEPWKFPLVAPHDQLWAMANGVDLSHPAWTALRGDDTEVLVGVVSYGVRLAWQRENVEPSLFPAVRKILDDRIESHCCDPVLSRLLANLRPYWRKDGRTALAIRETRAALLDWLDVPQLSERVKSQIRSMLNDDLGSATDIVEALRRATSHSEAAGLIRKWLDNDEKLLGDFSVVIQSARHSVGSWAFRAFSDALLNCKQVQSKHGAGAILVSLAGHGDLTPEDACICLMVMQETASNYQSQSREWDAKFTLADDAEDTRIALRRWITKVSAPFDPKLAEFRIGESGNLGVLILSAELPLEDRLELLSEMLVQSESVDPQAQDKILNRLYGTDVNALLAHQQGVLEVLRLILTAKYTPNTSKHLEANRKYVAACVVTRSETLLRILGYPPVPGDVGRRLSDYSQEAAGCTDEFVKRQLPESIVALEQAGYFK